MRNYQLLITFTLLLSACAPFDLWLGQSSCQTASSDPQVMTLSWKPDWKIASVDLNQNGEFFFSAYSDIDSKLRWDTLIRVNREGQQTEIRTGPEVTKPMTYIYFGNDPGPPTGSPGSLSVFGSFVWISDYRAERQLRRLDVGGLWPQEEVLFKGQYPSLNLWASSPTLSGAQGELFIFGVDCSIYQMRSHVAELIFQTSDEINHCPIRRDVIAVDGNRFFYSIPSRYHAMTILIEDLVSNAKDVDVSDKTITAHTSHAIYRIGGSQFESWAGSAVEGFKDGLREQARFKEPSHLAAARDGTVYVSDTGNHAIRKISPTGEVTTLVGNGTAGAEDGSLEQARLDTPQHILLGPCHRLYVFDKNGVREIALPPGPSAERWGPPVTSEAKAES